MSASVDSADDLCHLHSHPGPHILTRLPHQHEGRVLHRFFIEANIFLSAENIFSRNILSTGRLSEHHSEYDHFQQEDDRSTEKVSAKSILV